MLTTGLLVAVLAALALVLVLSRREVARLHAAESRYRTLVERIPVGLYRTTPDGRNLAANPAIVQMLGYPDLDTFQRGSVTGLYANPDDRTRWQALMEQEDVVRDFEMLARRRDGTVIWVRDSARALRDSDGRVLYYEGVWEDITARKAAEVETQRTGETLAARVTELEQRTRDMTLLTEMMELLQGCATPDEAHAVIGQFLPRLFPHSAGALCILSASGNVVEAVATWGEPPVGDPIFPPDDCWALRRGQVHLVETAGTVMRCKHLSAGPSSATVCIPLLGLGEALGVFTLAHRPDGAADAPSAIREPTRLLAVTAAEHTALSLANLRLRESLRLQSIRDPLTGLFNRRYLEETLEREVRRMVRKGTPLGIVMLDLDHFKQFNDSFGHEAGDLLLRELGNLLRTSVRSEDIACRYGGEEFILVLPEAPLDAVQARAERVREAVRQLQVQFRGQFLGVITISVGVAIFPACGATVEELLRAADGALYRAKAAGRDRVVVAEKLAG